jgi:hypothetical protein
MQQRSACRLNVDDYLSTGERTRRLANFNRLAILVDLLLPFSYSWVILEDGQGAITVAKRNIQDYAAASKSVTAFPDIASRSIAVGPLRRSFELQTGYVLV